MKLKNRETGTEVTTPKRTTLSLPPKWSEELAQDAKDESALEAPDVQSFSTRAGVLSYADVPLPNNEINVIILAAGFINALFINKFDPGNIVSPLCFAMDDTGEEMAPHENSFKPQNEACVGCEHAEWGSDVNSPSGRGKACKETRRLACIPADALTTGIDKAKVAILSVPVTSVANWGQYIHTLSATAKRPPWSVVTKVYLKPDAKKQFTVNFEAVDVINEPEQLAALKAVRAKAKQAALTPFAMMTKEQFDEIQAEKEKPQKKRKF